MTVLTILNHGTDNSSSKKASDLVINKLSELLAGDEGVDWILNEGAGTGRLFKRADIGGREKPPVQKAAFWAAGVVAGKGVEDNVNTAVAFVKNQMAARKEVQSGMKVNLAGHSRGSITCYKIARALKEDAETAAIPVNIFAIDPVPGNMGTLNQANYKNIALGGNIVNSFLLLAESEHRLAFRPYVDALYSMGLANHRLETMPGTHGGINELAGEESEAAHLVMSLAVEFLDENQTAFKEWKSMWVLGSAAKRETYAKLMRRIKKYKGHASMWKVGNLVTAGLQVDRERTAVVHGTKQGWGIGVAGPDDADAGRRGRSDHRGLKLNEALQRGNALPGGQVPHSTRPNRFFANLEHHNLFTEAYPALSGVVLKLEPGVRDAGEMRAVASLLPQIWQTTRPRMSADEIGYASHWFGKLGL